MVGGGILKKAVTFQAKFKRKIFWLLLSFCSLAFAEEVEPKKLALTEAEIKTDWGKENPCGKDIPLTLCQAVKLTLEYQQKVKISIESVKRQAGVVQETGAPFDPYGEFDFKTTQTQNAQNIDITTTKHGEINEATIKESKKFRIGTEVSVTADIQQVLDPTLVLTVVEPLNNFIRYNLSNITFRLNQPLLKGFLYGLEAMEERASIWHLKSTYYDALFSISQDVLDAIIRYWNVVRAQQEILIRKKAVESFELLVRKTKRLVEENQIAQSEINQPLASLFNERANYLAALQELYSSMQQLKLSIGMVPTACISKDLFKAVDDFPELIPEEAICEWMDRLVGYGILYRLDLKASLMRQCEFQTLLQGAKNALLPRLDVFGEYNVMDVKRGRAARQFFSSIDYYIPERNYTAGVVLSRPICNDEAQGRYRRVLADLNKTCYETIDLKQTIMTSVMDIWMNHLRLVKEIKDAQKAAEYFEKLVVDENKRLDAGVGSLFNLIDYQNRQIDSQDRLLSIRRQYAENLARLHFETGMLLTPNSNLCSFGVQNVTRLPDGKCYE
jgi:outer membrane protein TolC